MKNSRPLVWIASVLGVLVVATLVGGGVYMYAKIHTRMNVEDAFVASNAKPWYVESPSSDTTLRTDASTTIISNIDNKIISSFPEDFELWVMVYVQKEGEAAGVSVGDGWLLNKTIVERGKYLKSVIQWDIPGYVKTGQLTTGTYKATLKLQAQLKDPARMCAEHEGTECFPNAADREVIARASRIKTESELFSILEPQMAAGEVHMKNGLSFTLPTSWAGEPLTDGGTSEYIKISTATSKNIASIQCYPYKPFENYDPVVMDALNRSFVHGSINYRVQGEVEADRSAPTNANYAYFVIERSQFKLYEDNRGCLFSARAQAGKTFSSEEVAGFKQIYNSFK